ncbi:O-antigen polymerase [Pontibacter pudoricolor]|uniref:O-antigen polymerase n=1 Tax=Pontibacter pudoricolor TaxID=2694930 RepID=UPI0013913C6D|nr:O-antigen polymerase [Pontibacter pudoricolor]
MKVLIPLVSILLYSFHLIKNGKHKNGAIVIIGLYITSAFFSLFITPELLGFSTENRYSPILYLFYSLLIIFILIPLKFLPNHRGLVPEIMPTKLYKKIFILMGLAAIYSVLYQFPYALKVFSVGAHEIRNSLNVEKESALPVSIFTTIAVAVSSFYIIYIFLFFLSYKQGLNIYYKLLSFIGSVSYVVSSLAFGARDGLVTFILSFIFIFLLFKEDLSKKSKRYIYILLTIVGLVFVKTIAEFTLDRFGTDIQYNDNDRLILGSIGYIGQQPHVFIENIVSRTSFYGTSLRFPLIDILTGQQNKVIRTVPHEWMFGTFLVDFYAIAGFSSLIILTFLFTISFSSAFINFRTKYKLAFLLSYILYFQLITQGVFYFKMGSFSGNIYMIIVIILIYKLKKVKHVIVNNSPIS